MSELAPLETLYEVERGADLPLPPELAALYGRLQISARAGRPTVIGNFVTTLDGVVSLNAPGQSGGGEISGFNSHDKMVMGLLRAAADAVVVGAGTLRSVPQHLWTAEYINPPLAGAYRLLRAAVGRSEPPLNVIVTGRGEVDLGLPVFSGQVPALIVTTAEGAGRLRADRASGGVQIAAVEGSGALSARQVLEEVKRARGGDLILVEGGPHLMGDFLAEGLLDDLFLTLAPQIAGRDAVERPGLVAGKSFAPDRPLWAALVGVKRAESHLFLRYAFTSY